MALRALTLTRPPFVSGLNLPLESPGAGDLTSLCLSCPICKVWLIMGASSQDCREQALFLEKCLAEAVFNVCWLVSIILT